MSTCYRFTKSFSKNQVLEAMKPLGLEVSEAKEASDTAFCITNGECYLWAYHTKDGDDVNFCRYGANYNAAEIIIAPLAEALQTDYLSEHDDGFFEDEESEEDDND